MGYLVDYDNPENIKAAFIEGSITPPPSPTYNLTELEQSLHDDAIARLNLVNPNHRYMAFGFITDLHESYDGVTYGTNGPLTTSKHALRLLGAIGHTYGLDGIFFGGDYSLGTDLTYEQYDQALDELLSTVSLTIDVPHFAVEGNHDRWYDGKSTNRCRGNSEWKRYLNRFNTPGMAVFPTKNDAVNGYVANSYYVDFHKYKVRVVMRSQYETQEKQGVPCSNSAGIGLGHFANNLDDCMKFDTPSSAGQWTALCVSHYAISKPAASNGNASLTKFFNGTLNDGMKGRAVVGEIFGHLHYPSSSKHTMNDDGTLLRLGQAYATVTSLDSPTNTQGKTEYTANDYRFSLYVVDTATNNLHEIKVGNQYNTTDNPYYNSNTGIFSYPFRYNDTVPTENTFKFYHISDPHTCVDSLVKCDELMDSADGGTVTILTGDYGQIGESFGSMNAAMEQELQSFRNKLLLLNGNHEIYDIFGGHSGSAARTAAVNSLKYLKSHITEQNVNWGDVSDTPTGSYYYADYNMPDGGILRVISIDMYDGGKLTNAESKSLGIYDNVYSKDQIEWFIETISGLTESDYLLITMHEPPVSYSTDKLEGSGSDKSFCSSNLKVCSSFSVNSDTIPYLVDAYLHKRKIQNKKFLRYDADTAGFYITHDFTNGSPCAFIGYLCGHIHGDFHDYHPTYNDQLIMCIDWANDASNNRIYWSDIYNTSTPHRKDGVLINEVTLDFDARKTIIKRIGNGSGEDGYGVTTSGKARTTIAFPFTEHVN